MCAAATTVLLAWVGSQIAPALLPAIDAALSKTALLSLLVLSIVLNLVFLALVFYLAKKPPLKLKYGIYWDKDKNPHCPSCKIPIAAYNEYTTAGKGYYCKPCNEVFPLQDARGKDIDPDMVLKELK